MGLQVGLIDLFSDAIVISCPKIQQSISRPNVWLDKRGIKSSRGFSRDFKPRNDRHQSVRVGMHCPRFSSRQSCADETAISGIIRQASPAEDPRSPMLISWRPQRTQSTQLYFLSSCQVDTHVVSYHYLISVRHSLTSRTFSSHPPGNENGIMICESRRKCCR